MANFGNTKKFTKVNVGNIPDNTAIVYKIKSEGGKNLYTGVAGRGRCQKRLLEHKEKAGEKIPGGTRFQVARVKNKVIALKIEKRIIKNEHPKFNEQNK